jgi:ectoine hydroxylase-related dioxygenase (phytanoyl-CoA dioxygenase family)
MFDAHAPDLPRITRGAPADVAVAQLSAHGAIIVENAADGLPFEQAAAELEPWFARAFTGTGLFFGRQTRRFSGIFAKAPATAHLAGDPFLLAIIEGVLKGPDGTRCDAIQLSMTQAIGIEPGQAAQVLHRDEVMFPFAHDFDVMVNVMWAFDPWTADNGATRVVPRSQNWPRIRLAEAHEIATATAPRGAAIIWLGSIVHGGGANRTDRIRRGLAFSYTLGWLAQAERLLLSTPPEVARTLPERVQRLIGYQLHRPNLGWIEERDPLEWLMGRVGELAPAEDNLTPAQDALVRWRLETEGAAT